MYEIIQQPHDFEKYPLSLETQKRIYSRDLKNNLYKKKTHLLPLIFGNFFD